MTKFYQCDVAESGTESIWTSSVIFADSIEEAEFHVMIELQQDWGDGYMPDNFIDAFGGEESPKDPEFPGIDAWNEAGYWHFNTREVTAGMLEVRPIEALAKLGKIDRGAFVDFDDMVSKVMASEYRFQLIAVKGGS
jgi:hypothetical protein